MIIYLDFDGTVVEHDYPRMGRPNFGCIEVIKKLQDAGHKIILNTYRADLKDGTLEKALKVLNTQHRLFIKDRGLRDNFKLNPITEYCVNKIHPSTFDWSKIKESQEIFIDDIAYKIPLKKAVMTNGYMVDWDALGKQFEEHGIYEKINL